MTQTHTLSVQGHTIQCLHSPSSGPPVILLHGAGGNAETWRPLLSAWSWADTWCLDLPGRCGNPGPAMENTEAIASWLQEVIQESGLHKPIVVGHSFGGALALTLGLRAPSLVGGIVMVSSGARLRVSPLILESVASASEDEPLDFRFAFGEDTPDETVEAYQVTANKTPNQTTLADWQACNTFDVREELGALKPRLLIAHGTEDVLTPPKFQMYLEAQVEGSERFACEAGHMLPWEASTALADAVQAWI